MKIMKKTDYLILTELIKNSKISDRKLAKKIGISQPTVTRKRTMLEREGLLDFTAIPNLSKLGYELLSFNFAHLSIEAGRNLRNSPEFSQRLESTLNKHPNMIFSSTGKGLGFEGIVVSIHKNYPDYVVFNRKLQDEWGELVEKVESFVVSIKGDNIVRFFTFKNWAESLKETTNLVT